MIIAVASLLAFAAVVLLVGGLMARQVDPLKVRLQAVRAGLRPRSPMMERPFISRTVTPMVGGLAKAVMAIFPATWIRATDKRLIWAGRPATLAGFTLIWGVVILTCAAVFGVVANSLVSDKALVVFAMAVGAGVGGVLPQFWISAHISERQYSTRKALPDALDLMTTSVEAGLSLDSALTRVAEFQQGPFQSELAIALQDMTLGKSRREALAEMAERLNVLEVINFVETINQAEITGTPIGQVLRAQAEQVRVQRRQAAEAQAQRAPLLMVLPLVFFILPSLFVALLSPAAMTILDLLKNNSVFGH